MAIFKKVVLIGDSAVGKTSLRKHFMGTSLDQNYLMTIGADLSIKEVHLEITSGIKVLQYQIWDLAGQGSFNTVRSIYYNGTSGVLVVYDITNQDSYHNIKNWLIELKKHFQKPLPVLILIANKVDLRNTCTNAISTSQGQVLREQLATFYWGKEEPYEIPFFETSAVTGENVENVFSKLGHLMLEKDKKKTFTTNFFP